MRKRYTQRLSHYKSFDPVDLIDESNDGIWSVIVYDAQLNREMKIHEFDSEYYLKSFFMGFEYITELNNKHEEFIAYRELLATFIDIPESIKLLLV